MDEDPSPELDIATQMGFASFGAKPTAKKRKYNPATDAVVSASVTQLTNLGSGAGLPRKPPPTINGGVVGGFSGLRGGGDHAGSRGNERGRAGGQRWGGEGGNMGRGRGRWTRNEQGSTGSNNTPLGVRVARGKGPVVGTTALPNWDPEDDVIDDDMPGYVDDTPPDSPAPTHMSIRPTHPNMDDSTLSGDEPVPTTPEEKGEDAHPESQAVDVPLSRGRNNGRTGNEGRPANDSLPVRPPGGYDWAALKRGVRNERGDMCYYDASFVEDPWAKLMGKGGTAGEGGGS